MRYERVQGILESQPAICGRLGPKTYPIETRFGEKIFFSKEAVEHVGLVYKGIGK